MTAVIQSTEPSQYIKDLAADPVIIEMESEIPAFVDLTTREFMENAWAEAANRGLEAETGAGPARAIQLIRESR